MYTNHLVPLTLKRDDVNFDSDLYIYGSVICAYLKILCYEKINTEVTIYTCDITHVLC